MKILWCMRLNVKMTNRIYDYFRNYDKEFRKTSFKIVFPPDIYKEIIYNVRGNVLDIGTADGYKLENILQRVNWKQINKIVAIDPSPLYKKAEKRLRRFGVKVYNLCIEDFYSEEDFDTILMFEVIEHMFDPTRSMEKITTLLKSNGVFICSTPNKWIFRLTERISNKNPDPTHINEMTYKKFISLMNSYFQETKYMGVIPLMTIGRKIPRVLILNRYLSFLPISRTIYCFARKPRAYIKIS